MNYRRFLILIAIIGTGCSSSNTKSGVDESMIVKSSEPAVVEETSLSNKSEGKKSVPVQGSIDNARVSTGTKYSNLSQAIKNQDENAILKECSSLLAKNPNDTKVLNAMAMAYYKKGQYPLAKNLLNRALKVDENASEIYSNLGIVQLALNEKFDAMKSFKKSIELNPNDFVAASNAGALYVNEQDFEKALVVLDIAYSKGSRNSKVLNNYAIALVANHKYERADQIYKEALKENPNNKEILFNQSVLLVQYLKKYEEGIEIIKRLKFLGLPDEARKKIKDLESMAERK